MTAKEGLALLRAVRETLGEPREWQDVAIWATDSVGCIVQRAANGIKADSCADALGISTGRLMDCYAGITMAYDARDPVALDAALDALEREIDANG